MTRKQEKSEDRGEGRVKAHENQSRGELVPLNALNPAGASK
jgi:hypothetical protein